MNESTLKKLQEEIDHLHTLVVFLSSALLRKVVVKLVVHRPFMTADAEKLVSEADDCFRCARMPGLKREIAEGLEVAGHELMAKAVEIDTRQERAKKKLGSAPGENTRLAMRSRSQPFTAPAAAGVAGSNEDHPDQSRPRRRN